MGGEKWSPKGAEDWRKANSWSFIRGRCCRGEKRGILLSKHLRESADCWGGQPGHGWAAVFTNVTVKALSCGNDRAVLGATRSAQLLGAGEGQLLVCDGGLNFKQSQLGFVHLICFAGKSRAIWLKHRLPIEPGESLTTDLMGEKTPSATWLFSSVMPPTAFVSPYCHTIAPRNPFGFFFLARRLQCKSTSLSL